jgi:hypothetical protein
MSKAYKGKTCVYYFVPNSVVKGLAWHHWKVLFSPDDVVIAGALNRAASKGGVSSGVTSMASGLTLTVLTRREER